MTDRHKIYPETITTVEQVQAIMANQHPPMSETLLRTVSAVAHLAAQHSLPQVHAARVDRAEAAMESRTDAMTGLHNKRGFNDSLKQAIHQAQATRVPLSLVFMYFDNLKQINDTLGHKAGDDAIVTVANILRHYTQADNTTGFAVSAPARFEGGDDFGVALTGAAQNDAGEWWDELDASFRTSDVVMCTGIVTYSPDNLVTATPEMLCRAANEMLLAARMCGGTIVSKA